MRRTLSFCFSIFISFPAAWAADKGQLPERSEAEILKTVTLPEGYEATVFAPAPKGGYPIQVSAAIDGTIFVAIDENGSLGRDRNPASGVEGPKDGRIPGKIVRMRDTDGDGHADELKTFCEVESPRGVIWDGNGMGKDGKMPGTVYVMHPPNLTAYTDVDGDGKADKQEDILTGLGFDLNFRGADHTTNGCRLGIDGFIYIAMGDYGCVKATGKDGKTLSHRGGGIVRIRPDGTGLELVVEGTRNILDVAISPTMDLFVRDNTNDGGGWNDRVSFIQPGAHMGYPMLFKNFSEDMIDAMADFGGGSPCGSIWLDEPGLPKGLFTVEWGANGIFYHDDLVPNGAGWKLKNAETDSKDPAWKRPPTKQTPWLKLVRPTDMDVDASGRIYITSWEGATFNYNGPYAGYVLRVVKNTEGKRLGSGTQKAAAPDLAKMIPNELFALLQSPSGVLRQAALQELRRRGPSAGLEFYMLAERMRKKPAKISEPADTNMKKEPMNISGLIAAMYEALEVHGGPWNGDGRAVVALGLENPEFREHVIRALGEIPILKGHFDSLSPEGVTKGLIDPNPRVRAAAITALRRLHKVTAARFILPLVADADPVVAHLAVRALSELQAVQVCIAALDDDNEKLKPGALKALYAIYHPAVVDGLIARLQGAPGNASTEQIATGSRPPAPASPSDSHTSNNSDQVLAGDFSTANSIAGRPFTLRRGMLNALCRLANAEAPYTDPKVWWSTRPDTSGPIYQPVRWSETDKIVSALKAALAYSNEDDAKWLVARMYQCKVNYPGLVELMLAKAGNDTPAKLTAIEGMVRNDKSLPEEGVKALQAIATNDKEAPELRVRALRLFTANAENGSVFAGAVEAYAPLAGHDLGDPKLKSAFEDYTRGGHNAKWVGDYNKFLNGNDVPKRQLAATVLVNLAVGRVGRENEREAAKKAVEAGFKKPEQAAALLAAIARSGAKPLAPLVEANLNNPNNAVAEAALFAHQKLGLGGAQGKQIGQMKYEEVFAAVQKGGDVKVGSEMFLKAGCIACHTVNPDEPPKGPLLSAVAKIYDRAALTESILKPNAKIAQGFETTWVKTKKGEQVEGFVTREGGDSVDIRNIVGQTVTLEKADIAERGHRETSMMPEGLLNAFTPADLANLLAWLESLKK